MVAILRERQKVGDANGRVYVKILTVMCPSADTKRPRNLRRYQNRFSRVLLRDWNWPERADEGNHLVGGESLRDAMTARPVGKRRREGRRHR
jgi:hypothetical protein